MEKILKIFTKESGSINQAALLLGSLTLLSQILALFRDRSIAHFIGPSPSLDAYYAAFRVPDLIFICIASLASITVIIPFLIARMDGDKVTPEARKYLNDIFTVFFGLMVLVSLAAFFLMPRLISFIYSLSPIFYNLGIIAGVIFLYPFFGIYGLGLGVVFGALMHFGVQAIASRSCGFMPKFSFSINFRDIKQAALISLPRTLGLTFNNIALISIIAMASFLKRGAISIFNLSLNLQSVPLNIIGISYAVAAFPSLAKSFGGGQKDEFKKYLKTAGRAIVFWSLPVIFLFIVLRAQIVRVILGSGSFSWNDTRLVAASLAIFSVSILAQGMIALLSRSYYAIGNTRRPLIVNLFSSVLIIILSYFLIYLFENVLLFRFFIESMLKVGDIPGTEVLMLPLAYSIGTILNFVLHWVSVKKDFMPEESFITKTFFQGLGASFFLGLTAYLCLNILSPVFGTTTFWGIFLQGFISGIMGIAAAVLVLYLLGNEELKNLAQALTSKFWRAKIIAPAQEEL